MSTDSDEVRRTQVIKTYPMYRQDGTVVQVTIPDRDDEGICPCEHPESAHREEASGFSPCSECDCEWFEDQDEIVS